MEKNFECKQCNFNTDKKGNYNRHLKTKKHLDIHRMEYCNLCEYNTHKKTNLIIYGGVDDIWFDLKEKKISCSRL